MLAFPLLKMHSTTAVALLDMDAADVLIMDEDERDDSPITATAATGADTAVAAGGGGGFTAAALPVMDAANPNPNPNPNRQRDVSPITATADTGADTAVAAAGGGGFTAAALPVMDAANPNPNPNPVAAAGLKRFPAVPGLWSVLFALCAALGYVPDECSAQHVVDTTCAWFMENRDELHGTTEDTVEEWLLQFMENSIQLEYQTLWLIRYGQVEGTCSEPCLLYMSPGQRSSR